MREHAFLETARAIQREQVDGRIVHADTDPTGVQEMVETFDQNQNQLQAELLRHGALNWVTRGVYFGDQRNYLETDIDDNFLPDDTWDTTTHTTDYTPANALREQPTDVEYAAKWAAANWGVTSTVAMPLTAAVMESVAVNIWTPVVLSVALNVPVPLVRVESAGKTAWPSLLVK